MLTGINWQYTNDFNDINDAIINHDENWDGLNCADDIISITYDNNHGCYVVFWKYNIDRNSVTKGGAL